MAFTIKQGDTAPALRVQLLNANEEPINLETAQNVRLLIEDGRENVFVDEDLDGGVSILNASEARVQYSWSEQDTSEEGQKQASFIVTFDSGETETFPNKGYIYISVEDTITG